MPAKRRHYSKDLKQRVVHQSKILGYSTTQIAENLDMSLRVVQNVLQLYDEVGEVVRDPKTYGRQGRQMILDTGIIEVGLINIQIHISFLIEWKHTAVHVRDFGEYTGYISR